MTRAEYEALPYAHYSGLRMFLTCPRLYYERYIEKSYSEPEQDYFVYGSLVDCLVTTPDELNERFIRVERRSKGETLALEREVVELTQEVATLKQNNTKRAASMVETREKKIALLEEEIQTRKSLNGKTQVTNAIWEDAFETAEKIKENAYLKHLFGSYQVFPQYTIAENTRKGIIDLLFKNDLGEYVIVDIKTTFRLRELNPEDYAAQLAFYREMLKNHVDDVTSIRCIAIVGDKDPSRKMAQDFEYSDETLSRHLETVLETERNWSHCLAQDFWPSAKQIRGREQQCFRCSSCSVRPFSKGSEPVLV